MSTICQNLKFIFSTQASCDCLYFKESTKSRDDDDRIQNGFLPPLYRNSNKIKKTLKTTETNENHTHTRWHIATRARVETDCRQVICLILLPGSSRTPKVLSFLLFLLLGALFTFFYCALYVYLISRMAGVTAEGWADEKFFPFLSKFESFPLPPSPHLIWRRSFSNFSGARQRGRKRIRTKDNENT